MQRCLDRALDKQLGRHAMAGLAVALVECAADAQTARNSLFPEARDSPVIGYLLMACSMALDHFLLLPGNPVRGRCLHLVQLATTLGPMVVDAVPALAEGDFTWTEGEAQPT